MKRKLLGILTFAITGSFTEGFCSASLSQQNTNYKPSSSLSKSSSSTNRMLNSAVFKNPQQKSNFSLQNSTNLVESNKRQIAINSKVQNWINTLQIYGNIFNQDDLRTSIIRQKTNKKTYQNMEIDLKSMLNDLSETEIFRVLSYLESKPETKNLISIIINPLVTFNISNEKINYTISNYLVESLKRLLQDNPNKRITFVINTLEEYLKNPKFLYSLKQDDLSYRNFSNFINVIIKKYLGSDEVATLQYWELKQKIDMQIANMDLSSTQDKKQPSNNNLTQSQLYRNDLKGLAFGEDGNYSDPITEAQRNQADFSELPFEKGNDYLTPKEKYDRDLDGLAFGREGNYGDYIDPLNNKSTYKRNTFEDEFSDNQKYKVDLENDQSDPSQGKKQPVSFVRRIGDKMQNCRCVCDDNITGKQD